MTQAQGYAVGVDVGGTFTDVVCRDATGGIRLVKIPTTRGNPSAGIGKAIEHMAREWQVPAAAIARFVHGTTAATNAVLERKGARIGLITTMGFKDVLEIGRQARTRMYDLILDPETPVFLAPGARRREVPERVAHDGTVLTPLDEAALLREVDDLMADGVQALAICFLFSFVNPAHEKQARAVIAAKYPDLMLSLSHEIDPAFREYERTCVTAFDAYVKPVLDKYLADLERNLSDAGVPAPLQIMQSRGGICSAAVARLRPVRLFLSGPAAGVIGGQLAGRGAGFDDLITFDIGGTSCDIALVQGGEPVVRAEGLIDGFTVRVPMVDVNAIGAGGGSIAWLDTAGGLRVGPHSAGSEPGPACYGHGGTEATVTDASVVLGWIDPEYFAGGSLKLHPELARQAIETRIAKPMGLSVEQAALGIHRVINAQMVEGIRLVSVRRGYDPRIFALVPLGGGGPLHATALARDLNITRIVVPRFPGVLSALGLLAAPIEHEMSSAYGKSLGEATLTEMRAAVAELDQRCGALMRREGVAAAAVTVRHFADVCYIGQSYHLEVPLDLAASDPIAALFADFRTAHDRVYGHATDAPARFVNLRAVHRAEAGSAASHPPPDVIGQARKGTRCILSPDGAMVDAAIYDRDGLRPGDRFDGPAIVEQSDTTTLVEPGWRGEVHASGNLILTLS